MSYKNLFLPAILLLFVFSCQPRKLKVMCIGDSITHGKVVKDSITELSYRFWLWEKLDSMGYDVEMQGTNIIWFNENREKPVETPVSHYTGHTFSRAHEAYYGIGCENFLKGGYKHDSVLYASFADRTKNFSPDVAFIHLGSNDSKKDSAETIGYLKGIIDVLHQRNPQVKIFIAKLTTGWVRYVNHSIDSLVIECKTKYPGSVFIAVDQAAGYVNNPDVPTAMTLDWAHPNVRGQKHMADKWFKALMSAEDTTPPVFTSAIQTDSITDTSAVISWQPATDNKWVAGYNVYLNGNKSNWRYSEGDDHVVQCIALVTGNSYKVTNLKSKQNHTLKVSAVDFANNETDGNEISLTTK